MCFPPRNSYLPFLATRDRPRRRGLFIVVGLVVPVADEEVGDGPRGPAEVRVGRVERAMAEPRGGGRVQGPGRQRSGSGGPGLAVVPCTGASLTPGRQRGGPYRLC